MSVRRATLVCHVLLVSALAASIVAPPTALKLAAAVVLLLPLLLALHGLYAGRRTTLQWLAVLLVAYIGGASVEVVARSGAAPLLNAALLAAVLELGLVLALIRRRPTARE
jgi:uncharacterized membrane protein